MDIHPVAELHTQVQVDFHIFRIRETRAADLRILLSPLMIFPGPTCNTCNYGLVAFADLGCLPVYVSLEAGDLHDYLGISILMFTPLSLD